MREGWEIKKLGDLTTALNGLWVGKKPPFVNIAVIRNTNFTKDCRLDTTDIAFIDAEVKHFSTRKLQCGDIIIEKSGGSDKQPVGRPVIFNIPNGDYSFSNFTSTLRINNIEEIIPAFLHKVLFAIYRSGKTASMQSKTTGIRNLDFKSYLKLPIPVPPVQEQEKIVAELDCLSGIIEKKKQQLKELDNLAQSIFYDMFGNPITNEKGWEVKCIGEVCSLKSGNSNANNSAPGYLPYVKVGDMGIPGNESRITTSSQFVSRDDNRKGIFPIGTTIFPKRGGAIYTNKKRLTAIEICCDLNTMGVIPNKDFLHPLYLFQYFLGLDLGTLCNGAAIPQLNNCDIAPLKIEVPSLDIQKSFAQKIEAIEKQKELIKKSIQETETFFNSRMAYWFN